jgi:BMFP domain-containing protein YqiC
MENARDLLAELQDRVDALAGALHTHITVPSWWNKRTDERLDALEEQVRELEDRVGFLEQRLDGMQ